MSKIHCWLNDCITNQFQVQKNLKKKNINLKIYSCTYIYTQSFNCLFQHTPKNESYKKTVYFSLLEFVDFSHIWKFFLHHLHTLWMELKGWAGLFIYLFFAWNDCPSNVTDLVTFSCGVVTLQQLSHRAWSVPNLMRLPTGFCFCWTHSSQFYDIAFKNTSGWPIS